ncbi:hypothetical protein J7L09_01970 [bacterium]|nr:hypothetical protein [bacterium]
MKRKRNIDDKKMQIKFKKVYEEIGFVPKVKFEEGLKKTINWYIKHKEWLLDNGR